MSPPLRGLSNQDRRGFILFPSAVFCVQAMEVPQIGVSLSLIKLRARAKLGDGET